MTRIALAVTAMLLLLAPTAAADTRNPGAAVDQLRLREIVVRGTVAVVSPISVRASIGTVVTCVVRNRELVAGVSVGDHVRMKCVSAGGRWILRRLAVSPGASPADRTRTQVSRPAPAAAAAPVRIGSGAAR
jgi:hypothetical protein